MDTEQIIQISKEDDITVVSFGLATITGLSGLGEVGEKLRALIADEKPGKLIVDFAGVKFFSSQMLGLLVDTWRRLSDYDGIMLISGINPRLNRVFKITNLDKIFEFCSDRASAVQAMCRKKL